MTIDTALSDLLSKITAISPTVVLKVRRTSDDEASIRAYAPAEHEAAIRAATQELTLSLLVNDGLDVQVLVYDIATSLPSE